MADAPIPSATVVLVRDGDDGIELLLLQRASRDGKPGAWVFPGGKVDPEDVVGGDPGSTESARNAAVRETREESALAIEGGALALLSRWVTPEVSPKRFDTWFFLSSVADEAAVQVDGEEMVTHRWLTPAAALAAQREREMQLPPPTFVTITWLAEFDAAAAAVAELPRREFVTFRPQICRLPDGAVMLYPGDAGYEARDPEIAGARHRVWADSAWRYRYERSPAES